ARMLVSLRRRQGLPLRLVRPRAPPTPPPPRGPRGRVPGGCALAPAARGPDLRVLVARGVPAADRGLPALQAADGGAQRPPLVGTRAHCRGPDRRARGAGADPRRGWPLGARGRGPERAVLGP